MINKEDSSHLESPRGNEAPPLPHLTGNKIDAATREKYKKLMGICVPALCGGLFLVYHGYHTSVRSAQKVNRLQMGYTTVVASLIGMAVSIYARREDKSSE